MTLAGRLFAIVHYGFQKEAMSFPTE